MKSTILVAAAAAFLIAPVCTQAAANQAPTATAQAQIRQEAVQNAQEIRDGFLEQSRVLRQDFQVQSDSIREGLQNSLRTIQQNINLSPEEANDEALRVRMEAREMIQTKAEEVRQKIAANREEFRKELEEGRDKAKAAIEENREAFKEKVKSLNDEKKKTAVADFSEKISELNKKYTDHLASVVNNIEVILQGIISRTEKAAVDGKDVTSVREAITEAEKDIATARSQIVKQAATTYAVDGSLTDDNLRAEISSVRDALRNDLQAARDIVLAARRSVSEAAVALGHIQGINDLEIEQ